MCLAPGAREGAVELARERRRRGERARERRSGGRGAGLTSPGPRRRPLPPSRSPSPRADRQVRGLARCRGVVGEGGRLTLLTGRWGEPGAGRGLREPVAAGSRRAGQGLRRRGRRRRRQRRGLSPGSCSSGGSGSGGGSRGGCVPLRPAGERGRPGAAGGRRPGGCGASPLPGPAHAVTGRGLGGGSPLPGPGCPRPACGKGGGDGHISLPAATGRAGPRPAGHCRWWRCAGWGLVLPLTVVGPSCSSRAVFFRPYLFEPVLGKRRLLLS